MQSSSNSISFTKESHQEFLIDPNKFNGSTNLTKEAFLQKIRDTQDITQTINELLPQHKATITAWLRDPQYLLEILNNLPHKQMIAFFNNFFAPGSKNYNAIKLASEDSQSYTIDHARICFALMRDDFAANKSAWDKIKKSIENLKCSNTLPISKFLPEKIVFPEDLIVSSQEINNLKNLSLIEISLLTSLTMFGDDFTMDVSQRLLNRMQPPVKLPQVYINCSSISLRYKTRSDHSIFYGFISEQLNIHPEFLQCANFRKANLTPAIFQPLSTANLDGASFIEANLTGIDFSNTSINGTNFTKTILQDGDLYTPPTPSSSSSLFSFSARGGDEQTDVPPARSAQAYLSGRFSFKSILDKFINIKELFESPESLVKHLSYLDSIIFDDDAKQMLQDKVLSHFQRIEKGTAENIALLQAAAKSPFFTTHSNGITNAVSSVFGLFNASIETPAVKALMLKIAEHSNKSPGKRQ